jgi:hypothetical protein
MKLTTQQLQFFDTFGYLVFPGLLADRIEAITTEFEALFVKHGGGHNGAAHDGTARSCLVPFIDQSAALSALLDDPHLLAVAGDLLGDDFNYIGSDGNFYVGDTNWHSDGFHEVGRYLKIALYLDPVARESGALRVIPGSHNVEAARIWQVRQAGNSQQLWGIKPGEVPSVALESTPGDVVCFNHNLMHASFGGHNRRRMFTLNLCRRCETPAEIQDLEEFIGGAARFWLDEYYGQAMLETASAERMKHLEQPLKHSAHLPALSAQARATMQEPSRG